MSTPVTAIIPVAGRGTRMRPLTEVVPKELFPVGRLPVLHHVVTELVDGGVDRIVVVNSPTKPTIADYVRRVLVPEVGYPAGIDIEVVNQGQVPGNGGAILTAAQHAGGGPALVVWGDELFLGPSRVAQLLAAWRATETPIISVVEVKREDVSRCGIVLPSGEVGPYLRVQSIVEKPNPDELASRTASVGGFLVTDAVLDVLHTTPPRADGEVYLSTALTTFARSQLLLGCRLGARWYETGSPEGFARAFVAMAQHERLVPAPVIATS